MKVPRFVAALGERPLFWFFGLLLPLLVQQFHYRGLPLSQFIPFDTRFTYLPLARRFLEDASGLFADPTHLVVAPGSFIYLALLGADSGLAVQANLALGGLLLLLTFDALRRIAGFAAAAAVAWLIALSPLLPEVLIMPLSEPPQLLCLGVWLWSCALICEAPQRRWPVVLGGVALLLSILTRATYLYWLLAAAGACILLIWRGAPQLRSIARRLLVMHLIAAAGTAAYIGYNKVVFDFPMVATGSGAALYFGVNPAIAGYEPPYYGLVYDHFQVMKGIEATEGIERHLSIEGDRRLNQLAKAALRDMPTTALAGMLVQKAGATLFFSQAELDRKVLNPRAWHVLLIVLAAFGLWRYRRQPYLWMLGCIAAYQVAIMTLVMHSTRYAIGAVELPLTLLAAFGVAAVWQARSRTRTVAAFTVILLLGVTIGYLHQRYSRPLMPDLAHVPYRTLATAESGHLKWQGLDGNPFSAEGALSREKETHVVWENLRFSKPTGIPIVRFHAQDFDSACKEVRFDYFRPDGQHRSTRLRLNRMRPPQTISIGTLRLDMLEPLGGTLRITMRCPPGTRLQFENLEIDSIDRGPHYLRQIEQAARSGD